MTTLERARRERICRICEQPDTGAMTYNYGREFAHTRCVSESVEDDIAAEKAERYVLQNYFDHEDNLACRLSIEDVRKIAAIVQGKGTSTGKDD